MVSLLSFLFTFNLTAVGWSEAEWEEEMTLKLCKHCAAIGKNCVISIVLAINPDRSSSRDCYEGS